MLMAAGNRCKSQVAGSSRKSQWGRSKLLSSLNLVVSVVWSGKRNRKQKERQRHGKCDRRNKSSRETREQQA